MINDTICVVGRPGIRDRLKPFYETVSVTRQLDEFPTTQCPAALQDLLMLTDELLEQARGHQITDTSDTLVDLSVIVFPISKKPVLMTLPLSPPSKIGAKPVLCRTDRSKKALMTTLFGDEYDLHEKVFASIASFDRQRVLCLVPEDHPLERWILPSLQIESVKMEKAGVMKRIFYRTKIFSGDGNFSRSLCGVSYPMSRLWFPSHSCNDVIAPGMFSRQQN